MSYSYPFDPELFANKQVLVAEDNTVNQLVLKRLLSKVGIVPKFTSNGQEVVDMYKSGPAKWNLILMDCEMPVMNGYDATEQIRSYEQQEFISPTAIVGLSAHDVSDVKNKALNIGMNDYLSKPLDRDLLFETLNEYLKNEM